MAPLKWGIVSAGKISHDFVTAVETLPKGNHEIVAVAARNKEMAEKFAQEHGIPVAYDSYLKLAEDTHLDIVYIGTINTQHFETVKLMLKHNKNVMCEKPLTMNEKQTTRLIKIAREKKVFFMEAVWSRCFPAYKEIQKIISSGEIGEVLYCSVNFGQSLQHFQRNKDVSLGGGAILDLGIYILQFQQFVFRGLKPTKVVVNGHKNQYGVDESAAAILTYPGGKTAVVSTSARVFFDNTGIIVGTKGTLKLPNFWCPTQLITPSKTYEWPLPETKVPFFHINSAGLAFEAEDVRKCLSEGQLECPYMTLDETIELAKLMDLLRKAIGVAYPEDSQEF